MIVQKNIKTEQLAEIIAQSMIEEPFFNKEVVIPKIKALISGFRLTLSTINYNAIKNPSQTAKLIRSTELMNLEKVFWQEEVKKIVGEEKIKEYYKAHKEYIKEYYNKNKEHLSEQMKEYREANREHLNEQKKEYYEANKEHIKEQQRIKYNQNKEHIKEQERIRYNKNKEHIKEQQRIRYKQKKELNLN